MKMRLLSWILLANFSCVVTANSQSHTTIRGRVTTTFIANTSEGVFVCGFKKDRFVPGKLRKNSRFIPAKRLIRKLRAQLRSDSSLDPLTVKKLKKRLRRLKKYNRLGKRACIVTSSSSSSSSGSSSSAPGPSGNSSSSSSSSSSSIGSALQIVASSPPNGAVDARRPWAPDDENHLSEGWDRIELTFDADASNLKTSDFVVLTKTNENGLGTKNITSLEQLNTNTLRLYLDSPMQPLSRLAVFHVPSGSGVCLGFFPGDVNASGVVSVSEPDNDEDIQTMLSNQSRVASGQASLLPLWSADSDRSGVIDNADTLVYLDLVIDDPNLPNFYPSFFGLPNPKIDCPKLP